ncbi:MAG: RNA polymerase sigma factor [Planctomycetota bacterium JB042]
MSPTERLEALPAELRRAVELAVIERLTPAEIADACRWSERGARGRVARGLARLRRTGARHDRAALRRSAARDPTPVPAGLLAALLRLDEGRLGGRPRAPAQVPASNLIFRDPANRRST